MPNFKKLSKLMEEVEEARPDREYLNIPEDCDGPVSWVCLIETVIDKETQEGKELTIFEMKVINTNHPEMPNGALVKQIWAFSAEPAWRIKKNASIMKSIIRRLLGIKDPTNEELEAALSGEENSTLAGKYLKVIAKRETAPTTGKEFTSYSYSAPTEEECVTATKAKEESTEQEESPAETAEDSDEVSVNEVSLGDDEDPPF
jgi:hypothetical protein